MSADRTKAEAACLYIMGRIFRDGQVAYLLGPGTEAFRRLTDAIAEIEGKSPDEFREEILPHIRTEPVIARERYDELRRELT